MQGQRHYEVYWDLLTPEQWQTKAAEHQAALALAKALDARTVDRVVPGDQANESAHQMKGERTESGDFGDRKYRDASDGGWFSWTLKVLPGQQQGLHVTYWGSDSGNRVFDILVDGAKLTTQRLQNKQPDKFYDELYLLPAEMTKDKATVEVKFQAHPGNFAGGVFGLRVLRMGQESATSAPEPAR